MVEGRQAGDAGADRDGRRFAARESPAVGPAHHVRARDQVRGFVGLAKEVLEHAAVALDRAPRTGAPLLLGEEGAQGLLPGARVGRVGPEVRVVHGHHSSLAGRTLSTTFGDRATGTQGDSVILQPEPESVVAGRVYARVGGERKRSK